NTCTRNCRFCDVRSGPPEPPDSGEPERISQAVRALSLRYCVVTSPTRDDLPDGGAGHFADTVEAIKAICPETLVEILIPDLQGDRHSIQSLARGKPEVIAHNVETVARLTPAVRDPRTSYERSLAVLRTIKGFGSDTCTKSGLMIGLGEQEEEIMGTMSDLRRAGCDVLTIGQYLQPSRECIPVAEYISPEKFETYRRAGAEMGFRSVVSGPLVRSSYQAEEAFAAASKPPRQMQSAK
ncbi:MAG: lipoyl synthase, partial [Geobacter sp.]